MMTLKNIAKRKELAQMVYDNYSPMTEEERKELDHEVGSAYMGYQKALSDIAQLIVDGKTIEDIKTFIAEQLNGKTSKNPFRFSEITTTRMNEYIYDKVKAELIQNGQSEKKAQRICQSFIEYPTLRENIIEQYKLETIRLCEHCGKPMSEGYLVDDCECFCSKNCVMENKGWSEETFNEKISNADSDNASIYWTAWEG